jgi:hypothetical protein
MDSNAKKACTANESMRQNHLQIKAAHRLSNCCRCSIFFGENSFKSSIHVCRPQCRVTINCKFFTMASIEGIYQLLVVSYVLSSARDLVTTSRGSSQASNEGSRQVTRPWRPAPTH